MDFYSGYPTSSLEWHKNEKDFYDSIYESGLELISKSCSSGSILDIGCSSGHFMSLAIKHSFFAYGIEPNNLERMSAEAKGLEILGKTIEDLPSDAMFDVITLWDVLEHIPDPVSYVESLSQHLSTGGIVFIQVPTCDSLSARILQEKCNMFDGIEHLTLFSHKSLSMCFEQAGYSMVTSRSVISDKFAINNHLSYEANPYLPTSVHSDILEMADELIQAADLGYKIQAVFSVCDHID